jgi:hypothetical protein
MRKYFEIEGYWKDDKTEFNGYIVTNFDDHEENGEFSEEQIFYYGIEEYELEEMIDLGEDTIEDFVVTAYREIED